MRYAVACRAIINLYHRHCETEFQNVCFEECSLEEVIEHVYDGLFSLGIIITPKDKREYWNATAISHGLEFRILSTKKACAFLGKSHPLAVQDAVTPVQLLAYPHAAMAQSDVAPVNYCSGIKNYDYRTTACRILVSDRAALYDILRSTNAYYIGLSLGNTSSCFNDILFKPIHNPVVEMDCVLVYMKTHRLTSVETEFIDELDSLIHC